MAYSAFHTAYFDRLLRYLLVVTAGDEHAAREALQGTFTRVVRHIRVFNDESVFWSWLTILARTAHADQRRQRSRYRAFLDRFSRHAEIEATPASQPANDGLDALLARHIDQLPAEERELLTLKYTERQSVREIAQKLATTEKSVESRLSRIRSKLKDALLAALKHEPRT